MMATLYKDSSDETYLLEFFNLAFFVKMDRKNT